MKPTRSKTTGRPASELSTLNVFIKCQGSRWCGPTVSLYVLGSVRRAVILLVCDEGGQTAEPDVAQAAVAVAATTTRCRSGRRRALAGCPSALIGLVRRRVLGSRGRRARCAAVWAVARSTLRSCAGLSAWAGRGLGHLQAVCLAQMLDQVAANAPVGRAVGAEGGGAQRCGGARVLLMSQVSFEAVEAYATRGTLVVVGQRGQSSRCIRGLATRPLAQVNGAVGDWARRGRGGWASARARGSGRRGQLRRRGGYNRHRGRPCCWGRGTSCGQLVQFATPARAHGRSCQRGSRGSRSRRGYGWPARRRVVA